MDELISIQEIAMIESSAAATANMLRRAVKMYKWAHDANIYINNEPTSDYSDALIKNYKELTDDK